MNNSIKFLSALAACLLMLAGIYTGCKEESTKYDLPAVTVDGPSTIAAVAAEVEVSVNFSVKAPAGIKEVSYLLDGMSSTYVVIPLGSGTRTDMTVPVKFLAKKGLTAIRLNVIDNVYQTNQAVINVGSVVEGPGIFFVDDINSIDAVIIGTQFDITGSVVANADLKEVYYTQFTNDEETNKENIPIGNNKKNLSFEISVFVIPGLQKLEFTAIDELGGTVKQIFTFNRTVDDIPILTFIDDIDSVDEVKIGDKINITGMVEAFTDLEEFYYTPYINGVAQSTVAIPIGDDKRNIPFTISVDAVIGLEKLEFTAKNYFDAKVTTAFTIKKIITFELVFSQKAVIYGESNNQIKGRIISLSSLPITSADYFIVTGATAGSGTAFTPDGNGDFDFTVDIPEGSGFTGIQIVIKNASDEIRWEHPVRSKLKHLTEVTINNESIGGGNGTVSFEDPDYRSIFCVFKDPHNFHPDEVCADMASYLDLWDFCCYQRVGGQPIAFASPAAWGQNKQNANRIVNCFRPGACRTSVPRLSYTMISPARPELEDYFDQVETEEDLWDLLDVYVAAQGKTIREIFDPVTNSNTMVDAVAGNVHWIGWGPYNGSGKEGEKGGPAQNGGLGLVRILWESTTGPPLKQVKFEIKMPTYPNYKEKYKDSFITTP